MKYYKDDIGRVYAYALDGSQDEFIGDKAPMTDEEMELHLNPPKTPKQKIAIVEAKVLNHLNEKAKEHGYDSIYTASLRASLPNSPFHAEGVAFGEWMDKVWAYCYKVLDEVQVRNRAEPTAQELLAELPILILEGAA